jgi:hypothetical protein
VGSIAGRLTEASQERAPARDIGVERKKFD